MRFARKAHINDTQQTGNLEKLPSDDLGEVRDSIMEDGFDRQDRNKTWRITAEVEYMGLRIKMYLALMHLRHLLCSTWQYRHGTIIHLF